jgi:histidine ammonia-lyase
VTVVLDRLEDFSLENLRRVAWEGEAAAFGPGALERMRTARADFLRLLELEPDTPVYGVTTGFGDASGTLVDPSERERLAAYTTAFTGIGVGEPMPERAVRAMLFSRLVNFVSGHDGVSLETAQAVADMLDGRPLPLVRRAGVDSQGELLQLTTLYHGLDGDRLQVRDWNALVNGAGCAPGLLGDVALRARRRARLATAILALSVDAANMGLAPYDPALKAVWGDPYDREAIDELAALLAGATTAGRRAHQAPISWRILARLVGHLLHAVAEVEEAARHALTRVNDNPVFLGPEDAPPHGRILSTGGFHVPAAYHTINWLTAAWADVAVVAAREVDRLQRSQVTGLPERPPDDPVRLASALLVPVAHDLAARAVAHAVPALTPLYTGTTTVETDVVMPLFLAYEKEGSAAWCLDRALAVLGACASQALSQAGREPAPALRPLLADLRERFPPVEGRRDLGSDVELLAAGFAAAVEDRLEAFLARA